MLGNKNAIAYYELSRYKQPVGEGRRSCKGYEKRTQAV